MRQPAIDYRVSIGLEVHVQLKTHSKMFCGCAVEFDAAPNSRTCPTCLGLPGALPVMNREALHLTVLTGLMLGCDVAEVCQFDRKNYFYPDLPKNYQISQYAMPLCRNGGVPLSALAFPKDSQTTSPGRDKTVPLVRIHLEEDVAKSLHFEISTGLDFNRAGMPLMEIVTHPEISSPEEAFAFLTALKQMVVYGGISDADMEKGQLRCDCNISVRPATEEQLGAKIEIKNMNSISGVRRALAFEIARQIATLKRGETLSQETRGWNDATGETFVLRAKESAHDYRYFPDPDLVPVRTEPLLANARARLPELPAQKRARFIRDYEVTQYDASVLADDLTLAEFFEQAANGSSNPKNIANWVLNELLSALSSAQLAIRDCPVRPDALRELVELIDSGLISGKQGKEVFAEMFATGKTARGIVEERGLEQLSDPNQLEWLCREVIVANPKPVADFRAGQEASLNFLKGQVMKLSRGRANPQAVGEILLRKLRAETADETGGHEPTGSS